MLPWRDERHLTAALKGLNAAVDGQEALFGGIKRIKCACSAQSDMTVTSTSSVTGGEASALLFRLMGEVAGAFDGAPVVGVEIGVEVRAVVVDDET